MSLYKRFEGNRGIRYMKDNKLVSIDKVPISMLEELGKVPYKTEVTDEIYVEPERVCLFCGMGGCHLRRVINQQVVDLCDDHYYSENVGKIVQKLRESSLDQVRV